MEASSKIAAEAVRPSRDSGPRALPSNLDPDSPPILSAWPGLLVAIPLALVLSLALRSAWVTDDAYITLRTVDNFIHGYGLRWNVDERVQAYTHPLWLFGLSALYFVVRNAFVAALVLGLATTTAAVFMLSRLARTPGHAIAAILLLAASRTFIDFSTSGLENPLSRVLLAAFAYAYLCRRASLLTLTTLTALLALNRVDASLLVLPALADVCLATWKREGVRVTARALAIGGAPFVAWEIFSLFYYGTLVPNTAHAKLNTGISQWELATQGVVYIRDALAWDLPLLPVVGFGIACGLSSRQRRSVLLTLGIGLYLLYIVRIGGDFMQCRFLDLPLFAAACLIARAGLAFEQPATLAAFGGALILMLLHPNATEKWPIGSLHHDGVADERDYYRSSATLMNWTRTLPVPRHGYVEEGYRFKAKKKTVETYGCVGYIGFYSGPGVHIVDNYALAEPLLARLPAKFDPFWRTGHYMRVVPEGYVESLKTGTCKMADPNLCKYYEKLHEVVSGDLWSWQRLVTVAELNFGAYDAWLDYDRYRYPGRVEVEWSELTAHVEESQAWNAPGMRVFKESGVLVRLPRVTSVRGLQLMLDGNDDYVIELRRGKAIVATTLVESLHLVGARERTIELPEAESGFDQVFVRPQNGDTAYSLGYLRLVI